MNEIWNEICFELKACIQNNVLEKEYENAVCNCLQYLGLQGEQKNMLTAAEYYAAENGVNKTRYELAAAEAKHYYENASAEDIKSRADTCGKYITPKQADKQNKIIRSINRTIGL